VISLRTLLDALDVEIDAFAKLTRKRLHGDARYRAVQTIPGVGPILGAVFLAEIGDVTRFPGPNQLVLRRAHRPTARPTRRGSTVQRPRSSTSWTPTENRPGALMRLSPGTNWMTARRRR
jgi:transposase